MLPAGKLDEVELSSTSLIIGIINKLLLLHLIVCLYYCPFISFQFIILYLSIMPAAQII